MKEKEIDGERGRGEGWYDNVKRKRKKANQKWNLGWAYPVERTKDLSSPVGFKILQGHANHHQTRFLRKGRSVCKVRDDHSSEKKCIRRRKPYMAGLGSLILEKAISLRNSRCP